VGGGGCGMGGGGGGGKRGVLGGVLGVLGVAHRVNMGRRMGTQGRTSRAGRLGPRL